MREGLEGQADAATEWWGAALWPGSHPWAAWGMDLSQEEAERALRASLADGITREDRVRFRGALWKRLQVREGTSQTLAVVGKPLGVLRGALREAGLPLSPGILPGRASMSIVWGGRTVATLGRTPRFSLVWGSPSWESSRGLCGEQAPTVGRASPARKCGLPAFHLGKCAYTEPCSLCVACGRVEADPAHQAGPRGHPFRPLPRGRSFWESSRE